MTSMYVSFSAGLSSYRNCTLRNVCRSRLRENTRGLCAFNSARYALYFSIKYTSDNNIFVKLNIVMYFMYLPDRLRVVIQLHFLLPLTLHCLWVYTNISITVYFTYNEISSNEVLLLTYMLLCPSRFPSIFLSFYTVYNENWL
jgi:hypothetical protein